MKYLSGTATKISSSSRCNSSSVLDVFEGSPPFVGVSRGSHDATSRWLRASATLARLRMMSVSSLDVEAEDMAGFTIY